MAKRTLTNEQILSRFGSIEAYDEYRLKVSIYRKKRRQSKKAKTEYEQIKSIICENGLPYHPVKTSLLDKLIESVRNLNECPALCSIIFFVLAIIFSIITII